MRHRPVRLPGPQAGRRHRDLRGARGTTHVAALRVGVHVPESRSLKAKRAVIKPVVEGARHRFSVAAAEVDHQHTWQRADLGFAVVSSSQVHCTEVLDAVERFVWAQPGLEVLDADRSWVETDA